MAWGRDRGAAWVSYAPLSLPPYQPVFPPGGIVGEGLGCRYLGSQPFPPYQPVFPPGGIVGEGSWKENNAQDPSPTIPSGGMIDRYGGRVLEGK